MGFIITVIIVFLIILWRKNSSLKNRINLLETKVRKLEAESAQKQVIKPELKPEKDTIADASPMPPPPTPTRPTLPTVPTPPNVYPETKPAQYAEPAAAYAAKKTGIVDKSPRPGKEFWLKLEKQFIENWTGILGSVIMVVGIAFLSIFAALKVSPSWRFVLITVISAALFQIYLILKSKEKWLKLATWLRSSGGAIFLFGCLGSGAVPGLKWLDTPLYIFGLLGFGLAVNLYLGYAGKTQVFASLHVALSLAALAVAPQSEITLYLAVIVSLFGILLTLRAKWEYHLLITLTTFFVYHLIWYYSLELNHITNMTLLYKLSGIGASALIGITMLFMHYRDLYETREFERIPFFVHLFNWFYMAIGFKLYATGSKWNTIILLSASLAAFFLARRAKKLNIHWLFITDTLISETIALFACWTLTRWGLNTITIFGCIWLQTLIFLTVILEEDDSLLKKIALFLEGLSSVLIVVVPLFFLDYSDTRILIRNAVILTVEFILLVIFHLYLVKRYTEGLDAIRESKKESFPGISFTGILAGLFPLLIYLYIYRFPWSGYAVTATAAALLFLRKRYQLNGLGIGICCLMIGTHLIAWHRLFELQDVAMLEKAIYGIPFFFISYAALRTSYVDAFKKHITFPAIHLFTLHLVVYTYFLCKPSLPFIPGVLWLILSVVYLETSLAVSRAWEGLDLQVVKNKGASDKHLMIWAYLFLPMFLVRHILVHLQSEIYILGFKMRLLIELFALGVGVYWATTKKTGGKKQDGQSSYLQPLMWEAVLGFFVFTVYQEVSANWMPLVWIMASFALMGLGYIKTLDVSRFRFYSLIFYWLAAFHITFISSSLPTPSRVLFEQAWVKGLLGIFLLLGFIVFFYKKSPLDGITFPGKLEKIVKWIMAIREKKNRWIYYPYFLCIALFLFWTFSSSLLTLLWVIEAFGIFVLGMVLKDSQFRYVSLSGLIGCLIRLFFYDLGRSGTLTRALVFLGVGVLMLIMNSLYNKFRDRF